MGIFGRKDNTYNSAAIVLKNGINIINSAFSAIFTFEKEKTPFGDGKIYEVRR